MKLYVIAVAIALGVSTCCLGTPPEIRLPPFLGKDRKGSYDVRLKRTEVFNGKAHAPVEGSFHVDVTDSSIRVVTKRLTFDFVPPKYQIESIYSRRNGSLLSINTETGTEPSEVVYMQHVDDEPTFYGGYHGVSVINGYFWNLNGSLWDIIREHPGEVVANELTLSQGVESGLLERDGYWLLRRVSIHLDRSQKRLYSPKYYDFKAPSTDLLSSIEKLDCEYGANDREQKYRYELTCKYEKDQTATIRAEIEVQNYQPEVATLPLSSDGVYTPTIVAIPNGTDVGVVGETTIKYMWQDGRIVKRIDGTAIDAAESVFFKPGSRVFLVICSLVVTLVLITLWIVRLRRKASS